MSRAASGASSLIAPGPGRCKTGVGDDCTVHGSSPFLGSLITNISYPNDAQGLLKQGLAHQLGANEGLTALKSSTNVDDTASDSKGQRQYEFDHRLGVRSESIADSYAITFCGVEIDIVNTNALFHNDLEGFGQGKVFCCDFGLGARLIAICLVRHLQGQRRPHCWSPSDGSTASWW